MKLSKLSRFIHRWGSVLLALPIAAIVFSGVILQLKKDVAWIQPPTFSGASRDVSLTFDQILAATRSVAVAEVESWDDVDRLDVRPDKGMLKVRCRNRWEVQLDATTGEVLHVAYRRSDLIESIHDGSFFHGSFKLWLFLPAGLTLAFLWLSGVYLFFLPHIAKWKRRRQKPHSDPQAILPVTQSGVESQTKQTVGSGGSGNAPL